MQVPSVPARLQAEQALPVPLQAESQHTPSTQKPVVARQLVGDDEEQQVVPVAQTWPFGIFASHEPLASQQ